MTLARKGHDIVTLLAAAAAAAGVDLLEYPIKVGIYTFYVGLVPYDRTIDFEFTNEVVKSTGYDRRIGETAYEKDFERVE